MKSSAECQPDHQRNASKESNLGVWVMAARPERRKPWSIQYREGRSIRTESFTTEKLRDSRVTQLRRDRKRGLPSMSAADVEDWTAFKAAIEGTPWQDVVATWRANRTDGSPTVDAAVRIYLDWAKQRMADTSMRQKTTKLGAFKTAFSGRRLHQIEPAEIEAWIRGMPGVGSPLTFNTYRACLRAFFVHFKLARNPVDLFHKDVVPQEEIQKLTVEQARELFGKARLTDPDLVGRLALEAFAGLRFSSAFKVDASDINFADKGILLPARKIKTNRRHYIDKLPDNLWAWLKTATVAGWKLTPTQYMHRKSRLFTSANVPHPRNALRHSFATYHIAAHGNPGLTASILCHRDQAMLWAHYRGNATQSDGVAYFGITPARTP